MIYMGNSLVKEEHVFIPGEGCYYFDKAKFPRSANSVGHWEKITYEGRDAFMWVTTNFFD